MNTSAPNQPAVPIQPRNYPLIKVGAVLAVLTSCFLCFSSCCAFNILTAPPRTPTPLPTLTRTATVTPPPTNTPIPTNTPMATATPKRAKATATPLPTETPVAILPTSALPNLGISTESLKSSFENINFTFEPDPGNPDGLPRMLGLSPNKKNMLELVGQPDVITISLVSSDEDMVSVALMSSLLKHILPNWEGSTNWLIANMAALGNGVQTTVDGKSITLFPLNERWPIALLIGVAPKDAPSSAQATPMPAPILPTDAPLDTPAPLLPTDTPEPAPLPTAQPESHSAGPGADCDCSSDLYNCPNFGSPGDAQACYKHCQEVTGKDIHGLDRDKDGLACEFK